MYFSLDKKFRGGGTMEVENINIKRKELKQMMNVIKSKKKILFFTFLSMVVLFGCSNGKEQSVAEKLYKDLDAKETYEKAIEYFNENVTYVKLKSFHKICVLGIETVTIREEFNENGKYNQIFYNRVDLVSGPSSEVRILKDGEAHQLSSYDNKFGELNDLGTEFYESEQRPFLISVYSKEWLKILDASKEEDGENIVIKMKAEATSEGQKSYQTHESTIDKNGLLTKEVVRVYSDSKFERLIVEQSDLYENFNKKTTFDYEEEKQKLKDLVGKDIDVIKDMFE